ncbi:MAG TPA: heavy metal translocating P-type ATPase [Gemmatimonadales bacterium]|nr:heavy metal translocating P-type ATPase [Gemmatimonadales bacterium]
MTDSPAWRRWPNLIPLAAAVALAVEVAARPVLGLGPWRVSLGLAALVVTSAPLVARTLRGLLHGEFAADVVAMLAMLTAIVFDQPIPGLVVVLMQSGGEALERYAGGRASRAVRELEAAAPRLAHRLAPAAGGEGPGADGHGEDGHGEEIPVEAIVPGDRLLVRPGELVPCDGVVVAGSSHVNTASLTGEPVPVRVGPGAPLMSGSLNGESPLTLEATARASESQYERIVELVRSAQASKAPLQRLADRYAVWFTPLTLLVCAAAWLATGDSLRVLAILVVATPCPLILATPVAIIGGVNRAARHAIIFRSGGALEQLGTVDAAVFDKTGTLTVGRPVVAGLAVAPGQERGPVLAAAGAVERGAGHLLGRVLFETARAELGPLPAAEHVVEEAGRGVAGEVEGRRVLVGARGFVEEQAPAAAADFAALNGRAAGLRAFVAIDGRGAGVVEYADAVRPEAAAALAELRTLGLRRTLVLSGDAAANVRALAAELGIAEARGDLLAGDKVAVVHGLLEHGHRVLMVGDGTNDAPALGAATVGAALAAGGSGISAEAADVVLLAEDLRLLPRAVAISRRTLHIARQSIWVGLGCSAVAMAFAAVGMIPPTAGAVLQEVIDVAVILNALRAGR